MPLKPNPLDPGDVLSILKQLSPGTFIAFWFDSAGITTGRFQSIQGNAIEINVGGTVFYFKADSILAVAPLT